MGDAPSWICPDDAADLPSKVFNKSMGDVTWHLEKTQGTFLKCNSITIEEPKRDKLKDLENLSFEDLEKYKDVPE